MWGGCRGPDCCKHIYEVEWRWLSQSPDREETGEVREGGREDKVSFNEGRAVPMGWGERVLEKAHTQVARWRWDPREITLPLPGRCCSSLEPEDHTAAPSAGACFHLPET